MARPNRLIFALRPPRDVRPVSARANFSSSTTWRRVEDAFVLAFRIDHPHRLGLRLGEYRLHDQAGAETRSAPAVPHSRRNLRSDATRHTGRHGRLRDRGRNAQDQPRIERTSELASPGRSLALHPLSKPAADASTGGSRASCAIASTGGLLHLLVDRGGADIERAAKR